MALSGFRVGEAGDIDAVERAGLTSEDRQRMHELEGENRELLRTNEIGCDPAPNRVAHTA
jgi:hypothetical protein